jgi:hypothetical protein
MLEYFTEIRKWNMLHMQELHGTWTTHDRSMACAMVCGILLDELRRIAQ